VTDSTTTKKTAKASAAAVETNPVEETTVADASVPQITLKEYMIKLSGRDRRVELINAFAFTETRAGTVKDAESNFDARFTAFANQVVED